MCYYSTKKTKWEVVTLGGFLRIGQLSALELLLFSGIPLVYDQHPQWSGTGAYRDLTEDASSSHIL